MPNEECCTKNTTIGQISEQMRRTIAHTLRGMGHEVAEQDIAIKQHLRDGGTGRSRLRHTHRDESSRRATMPSSSQVLLPRRSKDRGPIRQRAKRRPRIRELHTERRSPDTSSAHGTFRSGAQALAPPSSGAGRRAQIEFVSANPTGPLHIGHGRGAVLGDAIAHILKATGWTVEREYYVNDAGRQIDVLALSVWIRLVPARRRGISSCRTGCYEGEYVRKLAHTLAHMVERHIKRKTHRPRAKRRPRSYVDEIDRMAQATHWANASYKRIRTHWRRQSTSGWESRWSWRTATSNSTPGGANPTSMAEGTISEVTENPGEHTGASYVEDGATWLRSTRYGDDKDRLLVRADGRHTHLGGRHRLPARQAAAGARNAPSTSGARTTTDMRHG